MRTTSHIVLEVCVDDVAGLDAAVVGGADRIELCSSLELGGLTPSPGLMAAAARTPIPTYAMIRPRSGGFTFDPREVESMVRDIDAARAAGLAGVVLGAEREGHLDTDVLERLLREAGGLGTTLHRAIDLCVDRLQAIDIAVQLGFERVLSSGGSRTAFEALGPLRAMVERAAGRLSVMPGSGIHPGNVRAIVTATGAREVHASCSSVAASAPRLVDLGFAPAAGRYTDGRKVEELAAALHQKT